MSSTNFDDKCPFCLIIKGTIPSFQVYETEYSLAFLDISPVSEGHTQVIPKYHAKTLGDLPDEYLRDILPAVKKVALATGVEQYNVIQNNGKMAFQHVDHVHFHVVPKPNEQEGLILTVGQNWPQTKPEKEVLAATLAKMKARI
ncbi:HIT-like protein [Dentipellis sp. KUC8613]|nr:HIT-like protein [Dentipellis sp. KUC8613]